MLSNTRIGKFTSSQIYKLMVKTLKDGSPAEKTRTYLEEIAIESRLGRSLNSASSARPLVWGSTMEAWVAKKLDLEYEYCSDKTLIHPTINYWAGTPDLLSKNKVADIKCPYTLKSFAQLADIIMAGDLNALKNDFPEYYWQLVSNAIITGKKEAELIVFCPFLSEIESIKEWVNNIDDSEEQNEKSFIFYASNESLPYIPNGGYYTDLNRFVFTIPEEDIIKLTNKVLINPLPVITKEI